MLRYPTSTKEFARVAAVHATDNGVTVDPTITIVKCAFMTDDTTHPNWVTDGKTASWENDDGTYFIRCLVGAGGDFVPAGAGVVYPWVRIDASPELVERQVDPIEFF